MRVNLIGILSRTYGPEIARKELEALLTQRQHIVALDLAGNLWRELAEETGFTPADLVAEEGWFSVLDGARLAQVKILRARETSAALRARMRAHIAGQREPELAEVRVVRSAADFDPMMPSFVTTFLAHVWSTDAS